MAQPISAESGLQNYLGFKSVPSVFRHSRVAKPIRVPAESPAHRPTSPERRSAPLSRTHPPNRQINPRHTAFSLLPSSTHRSPVMQPSAQSDFTENKRLKRNWSDRILEGHRILRGRSPLIGGAHVEPRRSLLPEGRRIAPPPRDPPGTSPGLPFRSLGSFMKGIISNLRCCLAISSEIHGAALSR